MEYTELTVEHRATILREKILNVEASHQRIAADRISAEAILAEKTTSPFDRQQAAQRLLEIDQARAPIEATHAALLAELRLLSA
jgi:hypothetical protein